jgi:predicted Zn-ribbon and HTH transcriptional regulator
MQVYFQVTSSLVKAVGTSVEIVSTASHVEKDMMKAYKAFIANIESCEKTGFKFTPVSFKQFVSDFNKGIAYTCESEWIKHPSNSAELPDIEVVMTLIIFAFTGSLPK